MAEEISDLHDVCNIDVMAHVDTGKIITTERTLFYTDKNYKIGETHDGASTMDFMAQEQERGVTIQSATTTCSWSHQSRDTKDKFQIDIIDTPGHMNFTVEVKRPLRMFDGAVAVSDGRGGVEPQPETVWHQTDKYGVPRICFINKMGKLGTDFCYSVDTTKKKLGATPIVMQLSISPESDFIGIVDLVEAQAYVWNGTEELGAKYDTTGIPGDLKDKAQEYHEKLAETAAETDDDLMNKSFEDDDLSKKGIRAGVRKLIIAKEASLIFCGSTFEDEGVQPTLGGVVDYLPSPEDVPAIKGYKPGDESIETDRHPVESDPSAALASETFTHPFYDKLVLMRVYSGSVMPGDLVFDSTREKEERIGKIFQMHADKENLMDRTDAGNIYTFIGLKNMTTSDTLYAIDDPITLGSMTFPNPVIQVVVEPGTKADQEKMSIAPSKLIEEDPTFQVTADEESGQTLVAGMGELQLGIIVGRTCREFRVECNQGKPQVVYRETIRRAIMDQGYTYKKQTGSSSQFAKVLMNFEPLDTTEGKTPGFENKVTDGHISVEFTGPIETGVKEAMESNILTGFSVVSVKATVTDGQTHLIDSPEMAFRLAGFMCFRETAPKAKPVILKLIMKVEVCTPEEYVGETIGDLGQRRGNVQSTTDGVGVKIIGAKVPLSKMLSCIGDLCSKTQDHAMFIMEVDSYDEVPKSVPEEIIKAQRGE